jgi:site-specific recombinase XerD
VRELISRDTKFRDHPMHEDQKGKLSIQYIHGCGRAVRSFSTWVYEEGYLDDKVMRRLKLPRLPATQPEPLTEEEIRWVLAACLDSTYECRRNFAMLMLFIDTGIRLGELVNLRLSRIDFLPGETTIIGKGNIERKVPVSPQAKKALLEYISKERREPLSPQDADRLFLTVDGTPMMRTAVANVFDRVKVRAEVPKLHPHVCRHTFSVGYLVNGGMPLACRRSWDTLRWR